MSRPTLLCLGCLFLLMLCALAAQAQSVSIYRPMPGISQILGSAQMDQDGQEEIAILFSDDHLMIIDSYTGAVEFDSAGYGWNRIMPPGYNIDNTVDNYAGHNYGFDVFVDDDNDGIYCLMTLISEGNIYEQQLAVICLREPPTGVVPDASRPSSLDQNHPNPFNPQTTIDYHLSSAGRTVMRVFDVRGAEVRTLVNEVQTAGPQQVTWDGKDDAGRAVASGVYFYQLETNGRLLTKKSIMIK